MPEIARTIPFSNPKEVSSILERMLEEFGNTGVVVFHLRCFDEPQNWYPGFDKLDIQGWYLRVHPIPMNDTTEYSLNLERRMITKEEGSSHAILFPPLKILSEPARTCTAHLAGTLDRPSYLLISPTLEEKFHEDYQMPYGIATYFSFMAQPGKGFQVIARVKNDFRPPPPRAPLQRFYRATLKRMRSVIFGTH